MKVHENEKGLKLIFFALPGDEVNEENQLWFRFSMSIVLILKITKLYHA